jgi:4-hydroxy-2-oxoglutarate aldolase
VFAGNAGFLYPALCVGAKGATLALANILPHSCCELYHLFLAGKHQEAADLQKKLIQINFTVTLGMGVPALKSAMNLMGYKGGLPRKPLKPLSYEVTQTQIRPVVEAIWNHERDFIQRNKSKRQRNS